MNTILLVNGLTPLQTWGLIALVVFALAGVWSLLSLGLDALNDWLNQRAYDKQYRANEERQLKAWTAAADDVTKQLKKAWTEPTWASNDRQLKARLDAQEAFKRSGRRVQ